MTLGILAGFIYPSLLFLLGQERHLTQSQLGEMIGVQKSQISRIENNAKNVTIETILRVFRALKAKVNFNVELLDGDFKIA